MRGRRGRSYVLLVLIGSLLGVSVNYGLLVILYDRRRLLLRRGLNCGSPFNIPIVINRQSGVVDSRLEDWSVLSGYSI